MFKATSTGLPDNEWVRNPKVGQKYVYYNGHMSRLDYRICTLIEKMSKYKYIVTFENGQRHLAYNTELKRR